MCDLYNCKLQSKNCFVSNVFYKTRSVNSSDEYKTTSPAHSIIKHPPLPQRFSSVACSALVPLTSCFLRMAPIFDGGYRALVWKLSANDISKLLNWVGWWFDGLWDGDLMGLSIHDFKKGTMMATIVMGGNKWSIHCTSCCHIWTAWKGKFISLQGAWYIWSHSLYIWACVRIKHAYIAFGRIFRDDLSTNLQLLMPR